jgi:hypothetical protein
VHPHVRLYSANRAADPDEIPAEWLDQSRADRSDQMQLEMAPDLHLYVLLKFFPGSGAADKSLAHAVVFHQNTGPMIIIRHDWQVGLDSKDRQYLAELIDDWARTPPERLLALFRQLESLSVGQLRATDSGVATAEVLEYLIRQAR